MDFSCLFCVEGLRDDFQEAFETKKYSFLIFCLHDTRGCCNWYVGNIKENVFIGKFHNNYGESCFSYTRMELPELVLENAITFLRSENCPHPDERTYICFNIEEIRRLGKEICFDLDDKHHSNLMDDLNYDDFLENLEPLLLQLNIDYFDDDFNDYKNIKNHECYFGVYELPYNYLIGSAIGFSEEEKDDVGYEIVYFNGISDLYVKNGKILSDKKTSKYYLALKYDEIYLNDDLVRYILKDILEDENII